MKRALLAGIVLLLLAPFSFAEVLLEDHGPYTISESMTRVVFDNIAASGEAFSTVSVSYTVEIPGWRSDVTRPEHVYWLARLFTTQDGLDKSSHSGAVQNNGFWLTEEAIRTVDGGNTWETKAWSLAPPGHAVRTPWQPGTYRVQGTLDRDSRSYTLSVTKNGNTFVSVSTPAEGSGSYSLGQIMADGLRLELGLPQKDNNNMHDLAPLGFTYRDIRVEGTRADSTISDGEDTPATKPLQLVPAAGYAPIEDGGIPETLYSEEGLFFEQPFQGSCRQWAECTNQKIIRIENPDETAYQKVIVSFDFTPAEDLKPEGFYQHLVDIRNLCSDLIMANLALKQPWASQSAKTVLRPRGNNNGLSGDAPYQVGSTYRAEIVLDILDEESYVTIYDQDGETVHTVGQRINSDAENQFTYAHTRDGISLQFGLKKSYPSSIYGQPHFWTFENLLVEGVRLGAGSVGNNPATPGDADIASDEGRVAFLAASLASVAGNDYRMDCGPDVETINMPPSEGVAKHYCVLDRSDEIVIGMFGESESILLDSLKDPAFAAHLEGKDIRANGCDNIDITLSEWQECDDAIEGFNTYAFVDAVSDVSFLAISQDAINAWDSSILSNIVNFFSELFGSSDMEIPVRRFHHGYFSQSSGRTVSATWAGRDAQVFLGGFVTNFEERRPEGSDYSLGSQKQAITMRLDPADPGDVRVWRQMTAALRISDIDGESPVGDVCGNGYIGIEEQCEPDLPVGSCNTLFGIDNSRAAVCTSECMIDIENCLEKPVGACHDDWMPVPNENACDPASPDPACPGQTESPDGGGGSSTDEEETEPAEEDDTANECRLVGKSCGSNTDCCGFVQGSSFCNNENRCQSIFEKPSGGGILQQT